MNAKVVIFFHIIFVRFVISDAYASEQVSIMEQKQFIIVVPSYNNQQYYHKNLDSIFTQRYDNYKVIYIDDCSTDQTGYLVELYAQEKNVAEKIQLIKNKERCRALANLYHAVHSCSDNAIIVTLDGDDWFAHDGVLAKLNKIYSNPRVWMTYGSYAHFPDHGGRNCCDPIPRDVIEANDFRGYRWVSSHLRTFYAGLFKRISYDDLQYEGKFFPMACDLAVMFPMLEMCGDRFERVPDILYVYNISNSINIFRVNGNLQSRLDQLIRQKEKYVKLPEGIIYPWDIDCVPN